jgi:hypothetical protein
MLDLNVPFPSVLVPDGMRDPVLELDESVSTVFFAGLLDVLLNLVRARVELLPLAVELEGIGVTAKIVKGQLRSSDRIAHRCEGMSQAAPGYIFSAQVPPTCAGGQ